MTTHGTPPRDSLWSAASRQDSPEFVKAEEQAMTATGRRGAMCQAVLDSLRDGPKTGDELVAITHRFSARIRDLRTQGMDILTTPLGGGRFLYTLKGNDHE
jgi:hypothetical protein